MKADFKTWLIGKYGNVKNYSGMGADSIRDANQFAEDYAEKKTKNLKEEIERLKLEIHNLVKPPFGE